MAWRRLSGGRGTLASLLIAGLLSASGCVSDGDSQASFDPLDGDNTGATAGSSNGSGGSKLSGAGTSSSGAKPSAGSSSGGSGNGNAGTDSGGTDTGGTDSGGTDAGGTDMGGTDMGGTAGSGGSSAGGGGSPSNGGGGGGIGVGGKGGAGGGPSCTPKPEVCDGVDNNCDKVIDPEDTCPAGCTGASYGGHIYYFCGVVDSATAAKQKCEGYNMVMVSVESKEENTFVAGQIKGESWLGASDAEDDQHWVWLSSGTLFYNDGPIDGQFHAFVANQPNNDGANGAEEDCLSMLYATAGASRGGWNDVVCGLDGNRAICESPSLSIDPIPF